MWFLDLLWFFNYYGYYLLAAFFVFFSTFFHVKLIRNGRLRSAFIMPSVMILYMLLFVQDPEYILPVVLFTALYFFIVFLLVKLYIKFERSRNLYRP